MPKNFLKQIRESIKDEKGRALSLQKLANRVGKDETGKDIITASALSQFELGQASISLEKISKLISVLGVSYEELMVSGIKSENDVRFSKKDKKLLFQAMDIASSQCGDLGREKVIEIATEIYEFLVEFKEIKNNDLQEDFIKNLEEKIISGLAAKCFLDHHKFNR